MNNEYTGHTLCGKCGQTHWMHGPCPSPSESTAPSGSAKTWAVVYRGEKPVAAFVNKRMAQEWVREAPHRKKDTVAMRKISFRGIEGYPALSGSEDMWNSAIDAAIKEINHMMYAPSPRYDSLGRMTLTCAAKKIDALRKNPPKSQ